MRRRRFPLQPCADIVPSTSTIVDLDIFAAEFAADPTNRVGMKEGTRLRVIQDLVFFLNAKRASAARVRVILTRTRSPIT